MEEKNPLKDYVWNTGNAFEIMRLLVRVQSPFTMMKPALYSGWVGCMGRQRPLLPSRPSALPCLNCECTS